jgi:hypothetical protein
MKINKLKKVIAIAIVSTIVSTITPVAASAAWLKDSQNNWSFIEGSSKVTDWKQVEGSWYYFDVNGKMQTGWLKDTDGNWYNLAPSGAMRTGWMKDTDGNWYNLAPSGAMRTGWMKDTDGNWYNLAPSGAMRTGWMKDTDGNWYYLASSGSMKTSWIKDTDGNWYFANSSGAMQTVIVEVGGKVYALGYSGAMVTGSIVIGGKTYAIDASGAITGDKLPTPDKAFTNDGVVTTPTVPSNSDTLNAITVTAIDGVTAPVTGATPVLAIDATQYTATIAWNGSPEKFAEDTAYTATITIEAKTGYTLTGVAANQFTVAGATATNVANSGVVTAVFPATLANTVKETPVVNAEVGATAVNVGKTLADSTLSGTFKNASDAEVAGTLVWDNNATLVNATGNFGWTFTPTDAEKYNVVTGTVSVTGIVTENTVKETPVANVEVGATAVNVGKTLADSTLSGTFKNASNAEVAGTLAWDNNTTVVNATGNFGWTFTPTDMDTYNVVTGNVSVTVN